MTPRSLTDGFALALGGGGARGWAHIARGARLEHRSLRPRRIVGTSMGALIGAGMAAGRSADEMEAEALRTRSRGGCDVPAASPSSMRDRCSSAWSPISATRRSRLLPIPLGITTF